MTTSLAADANRGRVALISGGGTGIGRATARAFASSGAGWRSAAAAPSRSRRSARSSSASGAECLAFPCDLREPEQVTALLDATLERFGAVDVLVNNAGGQFTAPAEEVTAKGLRAIGRLNLDAVWELTREVANRSMIPGSGGLIVFLGFSPRRGIPGFAHAAALRAGLENLAAGLALEWSRHGIRSVCVVPGNIETEGLAAYGAEALEASRRQVPLGRLGRPEEVGETIAFLASEGGGYVTGTSVVVDGGLDAWGQAEPPPPA